MFAEKYVLSFLVLLIAWHDHPRLLDWTARAGTGPFAFLVIVQRSMRFLLNLAIGAALLGASRPLVSPSNLKELLVPLAPFLFPLVYDAASWFPMPLRRNVFPTHWQVPLAAAGLAFGVIGYTIAIWSVASLGRSFGIVVAVRGVVLDGPYRYVRHPMYLGYVCIAAGAAFGSFSIAILSLVSLHALLFVYRADLEEFRLAEASADYREYVKRTGFLFPRFRGLPPSLDRRFNP